MTHLAKFNVHVSHFITPVCEYGNKNNFILDKNMYVSFSLVQKKVLLHFPVQYILSVNLKRRATIFSVYRNFDVTSITLAMTNFNEIIFDEDILDALIQPYEKGGYKLFLFIFMKTLVSIHVLDNHFNLQYVCVAVQYYLKIFQVIMNLISINRCFAMVIEVRLELTRMIFTQSQTGHRATDSLLQ